MKFRRTSSTCLGAAFSMAARPAGEFFSLPPVHADLRPVQPGGPPIWIGGASEAAMRRVGRSGVGWLGVEGLQDEVTDHLWSIARRARRTPAAILMR
ncbi:LLM class flavin-dependent oxidoreductase [Mycobacterium branderi]